MEWRKLSQEEHDKVITTRAARNKGTAGDPKHKAEAMMTTEDDYANQGNTHAKKVMWAAAGEASNHMSRKNKASSYIAPIRTSQHCMSKFQTVPK